MAIGKAIQNGFLKCTEIIDIISAIKINSANMIGSIGGTSGGIPVIPKETNGGSMASTRANFQVNKKLPSMIGKNMGRNVGPNPNK